MGWDSAANWLMDHSGPGSFHGPAPYTPDGPEDGPERDDDQDYDLYLMDWTRRVAAGEFDESGVLTGYFVSDMIPGGSIVDLMGATT